MARSRPTARERQLEQRIRELQTALADANAMHEEFKAHHRKLIDEKNDQQGQDMERAYHQRQEIEAQNLVLQSDRDRLTATVEVLARRLASPLAEKDASRAGWRAANRLNPSPIENLVRKR